MKEYVKASWAPRPSSASTGRRARPASRSWRTRSWSSPNPAPSQFAPLYPDDMPLFDKINTIVQKIYRGSEAIADKSRARPAQGLGRRRLRQSAGLHGQDAVFVLDRPEPARRADRPRRAGPRGAAVGRRRLRRRHLRRDHDHAGPAQGRRRRRRSSSTRRARSKACSDQVATYCLQTWLSVKLTASCGVGAAWVELPYPPGVNA